MEKIDINIEQVHKQEFDGLQNGQLVLKINGNTVSPALVNTLRRLCYDYVPTYAFPNESITIEKNTSIFNNDYMRVRLSAITIPNIVNKIVYLEDKYWKDVNMGDPARIKHPDDTKIIDLYISGVNNTKDVMNVTTEHCKVFEDGNEIKDKFDTKFPCLIIQLRPNEIFHCKCTGILGIGKLHAVWYAAGNVFYETEDEKDYKFTIESQGQMDEYEILHKACRVLKERINVTKTLVKDQIHDTDTKKIEIVLFNEDHTVGNIINDFLQNHKNVVFSGLSKPSLLIDKMIIKFVTKDNEPIKTFIETLDYVIDIFDNIQEQIENLGQKFITYEKISKKISQKKTKK